MAVHRGATECVVEGVPHRQRGPPHATMMVIMAHHPRMWREAGHRRVRCGFRCRVSHRPTICGSGVVAPLLVVAAMMVLVVPQRRRRGVSWAAKCEAYRASSAAATTTSLGSSSQPTGGGRAGRGRAVGDGRIGAWHQGRPADITAPRESWLACTGAGSDCNGSARSCRGAASWPPRQRLTSGGACSGLATDICHRRGQAVEEMAQERGQCGRPVA